MSHTEMILISNYLDMMLKKWKNDMGFTVVSLPEIESEFNKLQGLILHERSK